MNSLLGSLLLTTESSVILGFSLAICVMACFLCISFYFILNFAINLRRVDAALAKYEDSVDWEQIESFIELDSPAKK